MRPYLLRLDTPLDSLGESGFKSLIHAWLNELTAGYAPDSEGFDWLRESGLADAVRDGTITWQIAA